MQALQGLRLDHQLLAVSEINCVRQFVRVLNRLNGFKIQDKVLVEYYMNGFAALDDVFEALRARLACEDQTFVHFRQLLWS